MDSVRRTTADMIAEEERLLLIRRAHSANAQQWSGTLLIVFGCCSVLTSGIAIVLAVVAAHSRRRSAAIASERLRLLSMLDFAPIMMGDMSGAVRFWSEGCQRIYGWTAQQAIGKSSDQLLQTVRPDSVSNIEAILVQKGEWSGELRQRTQAGADVIVVSHKVLLMDSDGSRWGIKETLTDITSLRRVEAALHASQAQFRAVVNTAGDAIIIARSDGTIQTVNPAVLGMFGYDRVEELIGRDLATLMPATEAARHGIYIANHQAGAPPRVIGIPGRDLLAMRRDGSKFPIDLTVSSFDIDGQCFLTGIIRDASDRKLAETTLRGSEARLRRFIDDAPAAIAMLDSDMRYLAASRRYTASRFAITDHQIDGQTTLIVGSSHYDLFPSSNSRRAMHGRVLAGDTISGEAEPFQLADGSIAFVRWEMIPWRQADGTIGGAMVFLEDETDRKTAEVALHDSESRLRLVQEVGGIAYTDRTIPEPATLISSEFANIYGLSPGLTRVLVADIIARVHPDDQDRIRAITPHSLEHGGKFATEFRICRPDGAVRWISMRTEAFLGPSGLPNRIISAQRDITEIVAVREALAIRHEELKRLSQHLAKARDQADRANRAKSRFLAGMSHELRTPLNGVLGYAQLLRMEGGLTALQGARVDAMLGAGKHLLEMITCVLDMSEIEAEHVEMQSVEFDVQSVAEACLDLIRPAAEAKGLALSIAVGPDVQRKLVSDPMRVRQVLLNLLSNATKFTRQGVVEVRLKSNADRSALRIEVADSGSGIPPEQRERLFNDFERLDTEVNQTIEGAGLGLALSVRLAALMGGRIGYDDNLGGGSVFWLELPLNAAVTSVPALAPTSADRDAQQTAIPVRALHVLVVDDVPMNRDIAGAFLRAVGHNVTLAEGGAEAVAAVAGADFDVVLMDVRMPVMDGLEATRRIRAMDGARGRVPIVALTAQAFTDQIAACRKAGMDSHLGKPFDMGSLLAVVASAVGARRPPDLIQAPVDPPSDPLVLSIDPQLPVLNPIVFERTAGFLTSEKVAAYMQTITGLGETVLRLLKGADAFSCSRNELVEAAHTLAGSAGMFGFERVATMSRSFERAVQSDETEVPTLAEQLRAAVEATLQEIPTYTDAEAL
jgi:PAS domain S-box-containing protein